MTNDPSIPGAPRPVDPANLGAPANTTRASNEGAAFKALLEKLENETRGLRDATDALTEPEQLSGVVDKARASLEGAVSLGDQLLEAYRASRHTADNEGNQPS